MRDIVETLAAWTREGKKFALASVVDISGSAPRGVGSSMAVREDGLIAGSVSGGCVESAVVDAAMRSLKSDEPELLEFGAESDAALWSVGLSCGGAIKVWVEPIMVDPEWTSFLEKLGTGQEAERRLAMPDGDFLQTFAARERLFIIGAVHIAMPLTKFASELGMQVTVIDPREAFAREERWNNLSCGVINEWPEKALANISFDKNTHLVVLAHDPKIDDNALFAALRGGAGYVGALGGKKTQLKRRDTLCRMGLTEEEIDRIHGPVGLDIGAENPEEIALSIIAQIVQVRRRGAAN